MPSRNRKIPYGRQAAILKMTSLKINRFLPIYISIAPLKFRVDIQSQTKVRVWKPKKPIWLPGGHFESDVAENQKASAYGHHQHAYEISNWNSKANLSYAPETMSSTDRRTDGRTDGRTSFSMNKPTTWCKSGRVSLVSSSCLYKTQPERVLAQVCHTRIDALSPDEYQFHLLLHRNSHHSQATYPKWLNH